MQAYTRNRVTTGASEAVLLMVTATPTNNTNIASATAAITSTGFNSATINGSYSPTLLNRFPCLSLAPNGQGKAIDTDLSSNHSPGTESVSGLKPVDAAVLALIVIGLVMTMLIWALHRSGKAKQPPKLDASGIRVPTVAKAQLQMEPSLWQRFYFGVSMLWYYFNHLIDALEDTISRLGNNAQARLTHISVPNSHLHRVDQLDCSNDGDIELGQVRTTPQTSGPSSTGLIMINDGVALIDSIQADQTSPSVGRRRSFHLDANNRNTVWPCAANNYDPGTLPRVASCDEYMASRDPDHPQDYDTLRGYADPVSQRNYRNLGRRFPVKPQFPSNAIVPDDGRIDSPSYPAQATSLPAQLPSSLNTALTDHSRGHGMHSAMLGQVKTQRAVVMTVTPPNTPVSAAGFIIDRGREALNEQSNAKTCTHNDQAAEVDQIGQEVSSGKSYSRRSPECSHPSWSSGDDYFGGQAEYYSEDNPMPLWSYRERNVDSVLVENNKNFYLNGLVLPDGTRLSGIGPSDDDEGDGERKSDARL